MINGKLIFGLLINSAMTAFVAIEERVLLYVMGPFLALSLLARRCFCWAMRAAARSS